MIYSRKGFSLVELLVVIAIVATMVTIAIPSMFNWIFRADYRNVSQQVLQILKQGRSLAVSRNREQRVEFDLNGSDSAYIYRISEGNRASNSSAWTNVTAWEDSSMPTSVALRGTIGCNSTADIVFGFNPNGSSSSGYICIMDIADLTPANRKYRIGIANSNTGRVVIE